MKGCALVNSGSCCQRNTSLNYQLGLGRVLMDSLLTHFSQLLLQNGPKQTRAILVALNVILGWKRMLERTIRPIGS